MSGKRVRLLGVACVLVLCGCSESTGSLRSAIVIDRTLMTFVQVFQVTVLKATTTEGAPVSCATVHDVGRKLKLGDARLQLVLNKQIAWQGAQSEARVEQLPVPAGEKLVVIARGLRATPAGPHTVASGCADEVTLADGGSQEVSIDVKATTGAPCATSDDCEARLTCQSGANFGGGYCAKVGCSSDADCLPGSTCALDEATAGLCARTCSNPSDCNTGLPQNHDCVSRSAAGGGCASICVFPKWNTKTACSK